ncbi:MAG: hydroxymethylglutaryl-CoA lyase [Cyclobacteriaceae bacterium]|nr:MAG: hydroxymethylglutaryl-CoA lyase [Cyclobacteriaceae bacterium]
MKIVECPRDAMQGLPNFIPTEQKVAYINQLLKVGFDTIDFGSFVSPKAIPQMKDSAEVLNRLQLSDSRSKLLAIVANLRGAEQAVTLGGIDYLGFPLSLSETFQIRNTNKSIAEALETVENIQNLCVKNSVQLVTYLSMGFGNPYNDPYSPELVISFVEQLNGIGIGIISLADTIGISNENNIALLFDSLIPAYTNIEFGAHLHAHRHGVKEKIVAAYNSGCRRFDSALMGFGGCPMAEDELVGNIPTETLITSLNDLGVGINLDMKALEKALLMVSNIFQ